MTTLVLGATGKTGRRICDRLTGDVRRGCSWFAQNFNAVPEPFVDFGEFARREAGAWS
jgi:uncharacterized protein YbjT (DUF2867 family)